MQHCCMYYPLFLETFSDWFFFTYNHTIHRYHTIPMIHTTHTIKRIIVLIVHLYGGFIPFICLHTIHTHSHAFTWCDVNRVFFYFDFLSNYKLGSKFESKLKRNKRNIKKKKIYMCNYYIKNLLKIGARRKKKKVWIANPVNRVNRVHVQQSSDVFDVWDVFAVWMTSKMSFDVKRRLN